MNGARIARRGLVAIVVHTLKMLRDDATQRLTSIVDAAVQLHDHRPAVDLVDELREGLLARHGAGVYRC